MPPQLVDAPGLSGDLAAKLAGHYALPRAAAPSPTAVTVADTYTSQSPNRV
jgi:hypothetical protein